jgi:rhomboid protease GluP
MNSGLNFSFKAGWLSALIIFNIILFVFPLTLAVLVGGANNVEAFIGLLGPLDTVKVLGGELWRLITANYLHWDIIHLAVNMYSLWLIGGLIYRYYGGKQIFVFYSVTGFVGSMFTVFSPYRLSAGASGAVFGLLGVLLAASIRRNAYAVELPFGLREIAPIVIYSVLFGIVYTGGGAGSPVINIYAHLGGFLAGIVLGYMFDHNLTAVVSKLQRLAMQTLYYVSVVLTIASFGIMAITIPARLGV